MRPSGVGCTSARVVHAPSGSAAAAASFASSPYVERIQLIA